MIKRRNRAKSPVPFKDRLMSFAKELRKEASMLPAGYQRDALLKRAGRADVAANMDNWLRSAGLQPPK